MSPAIPKPPTVDERILALLAERGPMQSYVIVGALRQHYEFRRVDAGIQSLRRRGKIRLLKRIAGERPFPLWEIVP